MKRLCCLILGGILVTGIVWAADPNHYIDFQGGAGVGHLGYSLEGGETHIDLSFTAGLGHTWFFHPSVGLQTGLSFTRVSSVAQRIDELVYAGLTDYAGEIYDHHIAFNNWRERQQAYWLEIPLGLRFRYFASPKSHVGLHAALGAKLAVPVYASYTHLSGEATHYAWYEYWHLELHDLPGRFFTESIEPHEHSITQHLQTINAEVYAELGVAFRLGERTELQLAAYGQYMPTNGMKKPSESKEWTIYDGFIGTKSIDAIHTWEAGIKIGISIWPGKKSEVLRDTVYLHDSIYVHDTICPNAEIVYQEPVEMAVSTEPKQQMEQLLSEAVIWFHFDDYTPILEPSYVLDSVAAMLQRHPDLRIHVNGHACRIGTDRYNKRLALKRAMAVAEALKRKGISGDRMFIWSYGAQHPYRYNSDHQLSKDRRVEIIPY